MRRTYTVGRVMDDTPCITIRGKWLKKRYGIELGSKLELVEVDDMIVLFKIPEKTLKRENMESELRDLERKLEALKRQLAT